MSLNAILPILRKNLQIDTSVAQGPDRIMTLDWLSHMSLIKPRDSSTRDVYERIMTLSSRAEKECPRAGRHLIDLIVNDGRPSLPRPRVIRNRSDFVAIVRDHARSSRSIDVIMQILDECDDTTRIIMRRTSGSLVRIETELGCRIQGNSITSDVIDDDDTYVACIDGFIETVAEIHDVLSFLSSDVSESGSPKPCLILARGASQDVASTLHANFLNGRLRTVCFIIEWKPETVNGLSDACIISGADMISLLRGDVVSSLTPTRLGRVAHCRTTRSDVVLTPSDDRLGIVTKKSSILAEEASTFAQDRSYALSTRNIVVDIPDSHTHDAMACDVDFGIRCLLAAMRGDVDPLESARRQYETYRSIIAGSIYVGQTGVTFDT